MGNKKAQKIIRIDSSDPDEARLLALIDAVDHGARNRYMVRLLLTGAQIIEPDAVLIDVNAIADEVERRMARLLAGLSLASAQPQGEDPEIVDVLDSMFTE